MKAIEICDQVLGGVAQQGYRQKENYPHNLHTAVLPSPGSKDIFEFENGRFLEIPSEDALPSCLRALPPEYTTCRIFRFAARYDELVRQP